MASDRDRSSGWKHAKLSGHKNEELVCELLKTDAAAQARLKNAAKIKDADFIDCDYGGLHEADVASITGGKTKNKSDITAEFSNGQKIGISLKKSLGGQVYLIKDATFIHGMERQYQITISPEVQRAIALFWGSASDTAEIIQEYSNNAVIRAYELHKGRLTANTLRAYDTSLYSLLLEWFRDNISNITDFCFAKGQALNPNDSATVLWYKNMLGEHNIDSMYNIKDLCTAAKSHQTDITYGNRTGGTVINLPFGFVQWHQGCMQFHHKYNCIAKLETELEAKLAADASLAA